MSRSPREFLPGYCYHITMRCNNRAFHLTQRTNRELLLTILHKARCKYEFKLYGLCIMSNHVHYLLEPQQPDELPKIMHWINWYSAMTFNALLKRKGHFWEQRYSCSGFPVSDQRRALCTLRYIPANPKAAQMQTSYFYDFSNYGSYERLTSDGLTEWHPAFLDLGETLEDCARRYQRFCQRYCPKEKKHLHSMFGVPSG